MYKFIKYIIDTIAVVVQFVVIMPIFNIVMIILFIANIFRAKEFQKKVTKELIPHLEKFIAKRKAQYKEG